MDAKCNGESVAKSRAFGYNGAVFPLWETVNPKERRHSSMQLATQVIGFLAVGLYLFSYQLKKRKYIVGVTCASNVFYVLQYILLGAFSGAVMDIFAMVSGFFAAAKHSPKLEKYAKWIALVNVLAIGVAGTAIAILQHSWLEIVPVIGAVFQTVSLWCDEEQTIRKLGLCGSPFWLVYNAASKAYGPALGSAFIIVSIIVSLVRYRKKK